jgi:hypothetical protein
MIAAFSIKSLAPRAADGDAGQCQINPEIDMIQVFAPTARDKKTAG